MSRRPRAGRPSKTGIRVRLTDVERRDLEQVARDNQTDLSGVVREAVNEYVADYRERPAFRGTKSRSGLTL